jgi:hypothetical protein
MKKAKIQKTYLTHSSEPRKNLKQFFCGNSKSKTVASVHCAYAIAKIKLYISDQNFKKVTFFISSQNAPTYSIETS